MPESQPLTDYQRAAMIARFVEIQDVSMISVKADLLEPSARVMLGEEWHFVQDRSAEYHFDEDKKLLCILLTLDATLVSGNSGEERPLVHCSGKYVLLYSFNVVGGPPADEKDAYFKAFSNINAVFNAWPFFRELVHSTLGRMGMQPIALPVYRVTPTPSAQPVAETKQIPPAPDSSEKPVASTTAHSESTKKRRKAASHT